METQAIIREKQAAIDAQMDLIAAREAVISEKSMSYDDCYAKYNTSQQNLLHTQQTLERTKNQLGRAQQDKLEARPLSVSEMDGNDGTG